MTDDLDYERIHCQVVVAHDLGQSLSADGMLWVTPAQLVELLMRERDEMRTRERVRCLGWAKRCLGDNELSHDADHRGHRDRSRAVSGWLAAGWFTWGLCLGLMVGSLYERHLKRQLREARREIERLNGVEPFDDLKKPGDWGRAMNSGVEWHELNLSERGNHERHRHEHKR